MIEQESLGHERRSSFPTRLKVKEVVVESFGKTVIEALQLVDPPGPVTTNFSTPSPIPDGLILASETPPPLIPPQVSILFWPPGPDSKLPI